MRKKDVLIYGYGYSFKRNIYWINQFYNVVGITDSSFEVSDYISKLLLLNDALKLKYEYILVVSSYYDEIREHLINDYGIETSRIKFFLDEFKEEREYSFGDKNKNIIFYIFRAHWQEHKNGFFNFIMKIIPLYHYTLNKGYELLIDMKNYYTAYSGENYGKINVWELYYNQPSKYTLDEAYQSNHIILSKFEDSKQNMPIFSAIGEKESILMLGNLYGNKLHLTSKLEYRLNKEIKMFDNKGKILGVLARGTDYINLKPKNHSKPTNISDFIHYVKEYKEKKNYQTIYLATEDSSILNKFQNSFRGGRAYLF